MKRLVWCHFVGASQFEMTYRTGTVKVMYESNKVLLGLSNLFV